MQTRMVGDAVVLPVVGCYKAGTLTMRPIASAV
jgi:hypothetical protein